MDVTPIFLGIAAVNLGVFLSGCALAAYRTWRDTHPVRPRAAARRATMGMRGDQRPHALGRPTH